VLAQLVGDATASISTSHNVALVPVPVPVLVLVMAAVVADETKKTRLWEA